MTSRNFGRLSAATQAPKAFNRTWHMRYTMGLLRSRLETGLTQVAMLACAVLSAAASGPGLMGLAPAASADLGTWPTYRNDQYGFELRYPPDYAIVNHANGRNWRRSSACGSRRQPWRARPSLTASHPSSPSTCTITPH